MSIGLIEKEVDGETYAFEKFGATKSLQVLSRLSRAVLEPLTMAFASVSADKKDAKGKKKALLDRDPDKDLLRQAVKALVENLDDENENIALIKLLCADKVLCNGAKIDFDSHYQGRLDHMFKVLYAGLEVQYGNFFAGLLEKAESPLPSTK